MIYNNTLFNELLDDMFDPSKTPQSKKETFYPPHNTYNIGESTFIEIAVTGFKKSELKAYFDDEGLFVVEGTKDKDDNPEKEYFVRNLSTKNFKRKFDMPKNTELKTIEVRNGLFTAEFVRTQPKIKYLEIN